MENELIRVEERDGQKVVSARDLHEGLEVGKDFTTWIKDMCKYGFEENVDFTTFWSNPKTGVAVKFNGNTNSMNAKGFQVDYVLTLDMAKEISMIQRSEKGKQFRKYFIECEKQLQAIKTKPQMLDRKDELALKILRGRPSALELKEYEDLIKLEELDGTNLILTCTQVVQQLKSHIPLLTTKYFNMWLAYKGLGSYEIPTGEKKRIFQPNDVYEEFVSGKGFSLTGKSNIGDKVKVVYTSYMVARIVKQHMGSLIEYCNAQESLEE